MKEDQKYALIKILVETTGNKQTVALKIGCTVRSVNRMIVGYRKEGKAFFVHGNHQHKPSTTIPDSTKSLILDLYKNKYYDCNHTHFSELLEEHEHIKVSKSTIRSILRKEFILSPKANRSTRKALIKELKELHNTAKTTKGEAIIQASILNVEDAHPRRSRCAYFGEMIQMDASEYIWFGDSKTQLHVAIDDATEPLWVPILIRRKHCMVTTMFCIRY